MKFTITASDPQSNARTGYFQTDHGRVNTPIFMPVGTAGTVKTIHQHELANDIKAEIILSNTYHLYLRPGTKALEGINGIHNFIAWQFPILTDSGGYQVYSLNKINKIKEEGVSFFSHIDGSKHFFSPEKAIEIQKSIGADIIMAFDECTPYPCEYNYAKQSMHRTHRWLDRCFEAFDTLPFHYGYNQFLAPIVQGSVYKDLRVESAEYITSKNAPINAIGGLSVGEPEDSLYSMTDIVCSVLPENKLRYLMGVGTPRNLLECIALGVDMFDCVLPTRNARHGLLYTMDGTINIKNKKWENDYSPIDEKTFCKTSNIHSKAYLRHLFKANEFLGFQIASLHNLSFYSYLIRLARKKIIEQSFYQWKESVINKLSTRL